MKGYSSDLVFHFHKIWGLVGNRLVKSLVENILTYYAYLGCNLSSDPPLLIGQDNINYIICVISSNFRERLQKYFQQLSSNLEELLRRYRKCNQ